MSDKIYIIGHKSPDLDSVAAAISYAHLNNVLGKTDKFEARIAGPVNKETAYILNKFGFKTPEILENAVEQEIILVDHNEFSQAVDGIEQAKIKEILDHHKVDFKYAEPICFTVKPLGSSNTIITDMMMRENVEIEANLAGLMLSAILVDTVITKSPTCTEKDKEIIEKLAKIAGIENWQVFGMEIFKVRSNVGELSNMQIIKNDFKDFIFKAGKIGIGQIETVDLDEFKLREDELITEINNLKNTDGYHTVVLFLTDIINEGSEFLIATNDQDKVEEALGAKLENGRVYIPGILSRKKQVAPKFSEVFDK